MSKSSRARPCSIAIGAIPNPLLPRSTPGLGVGKHGTVIADPTTGRTTKDGVWAGGDVVTGAATVIEGHGRRQTRRGGHRRIFEELRFLDRRFVGAGEAYGLARSPLAGVSELSEHTGLFSSVETQLPADPRERPLKPQRLR